MAGLVPAIRVGAAAAACICVAGLAVVLPPAVAQADPATLGKMQNLHRSLLVTEENLGIAMRAKDLPRARLAHDLLFNLSSNAHERGLANNACVEALDGLTGATVAVIFAIHPAVTGDLASMTGEQLRFAETMRPTEATVRKWFDEYSATYRKKMTDCEQEIGKAPTARSLPDKLPRK